MVPNGFTLLAIACMMPALLAQPSPSSKDWAALSVLPPGTDIRVTLVKGGAVGGSWQQATADALVMNTAEGERTFARQDVKQVKVKRPGHRAKHALIGLAVGVGTGLIAVAALHDAKACTTGFCVGPDVGHTAKIAAVPVAALFGTLIGAALPSGKCKEIYRAP